MIFLSGIALVLAVFFFSLNRNKPLTPHELKMQNKMGSKAAIDTLMRSLKSFGIDDSLIRPMNRRDLKKANVGAGFLITVPYDVAVPFLLQDIEVRFNTMAVFVSSSEKKSGIETETMITDSSSWKVMLKLSYNAEMRRNPFQITPLIRLSKDISDEEFGKVLAGCDGFSFLFSLSKTSVKQAERAAAAGCHYVVDISDLSEDQEYKLDVKFSKKRLNQSLEEILKSFPAANYFYARSNAPLRASTIFPFVKSWMQKRNKNFFSEKELLMVPALMPQDSGDQVIAKMVEQSKRTGKSVVTAGASEKQVLLKILAGTEKLGSRRVPVDSVLKR